MSALDPDPASIAVETFVSAIVRVPKAEADAVSDREAAEPVITRAVERLLETNANGYAARDIAASLDRLGFTAPGGSMEESVRSVIKHLRKKKAVLHNPANGRYYNVNETRVSA